VFEEGLYLTYSLFGVQVTEGRTSETGSTIENQPLGISIKATLAEDCSHAFGLDSFELFQGEVAILKRVSDTW
jgi:hypothetical protein